MNFDSNNTPDQSISIGWNRLIASICRPLDNESPPSEGDCGQLQMPNNRSISCNDTSTYYRNFDDDEDNDDEYSHKASNYSGSDNDDNADEEDENDQDPGHEDEDDPFERHIRYSLEQPDDEKELFASDSEPDKPMDTDGLDTESELEPEHDVHTNFLSLASSFCRYKEQRIASDMFLDDKFDGDRFLDEHFSEDKFGPDKLSECGMFERHFRSDAATIDRTALDHVLMDEPDARSSEDERVVRERRCNYLQFLCSLPKTCSPSICGTLSQSSVGAKSISLPTHSATASANDGTTFDWSIDQLATLRPVDITYNERTHLRFNQFDEEHNTQEKLSKASQEFFSQERIVRSPTASGVRDSAAACRTPNRSIRGSMTSTRTPVSSLRPTAVSHHPHHQASHAELIEFQPPTSTLTSTPCLATRRTERAHLGSAGSTNQHLHSYQKSPSLLMRSHLSFTPITGDVCASSGPTIGQQQRKKLFDDGGWTSSMLRTTDQNDSAHESQPIDESISLVLDEEEEDAEHSSALAHMEISQCRTPQSRFKKKMRASSAESCSLNSSLFSRTGGEMQWSGRHLNLSSWFNSAINEDDEPNAPIASADPNDNRQSIECTQSSSSQPRFSNTYDSGCFSQHQKRISANLSLNCLDRAAYCSINNHDARAAASFANSTFSN